MLAAAAAFFALRFLVIAGYLGAMMEVRIGAVVFLVLIAKPFIFAAACVSLLMVRGWSWVRARWTFGALGVLALALGLWPAEVETETNELGLVSQARSQSYEYDFSGSGNKDNYPLCHFQDNSLGYRDVEPAVALGKGVRRILLVGDSYIWGDGISVNKETLAYLLRAELSRLAPGRFVVMSAAVPGLGLYGYGRFIDVLSARYKPDAVVVGYLGESDHDPFDVQFLQEHLPRRRLPRNLILNLGAAQHLHETAVTHFPLIRSSAANKGFFDDLTRGLSAQALARGYRLLFLSYFPHRALPEGIVDLELPPELRYPGQASELWYAKDYHPKTKLNACLAKLLAAKLLDRP